VKALQEPDGFGMHVPLGMAAGAEGAEFSHTRSIEDHFGHNGARGIAGAQKEDVVSFGYDLPPYHSL
jgi:hypothetical protein